VMLPVWPRKVRVGRTEQGKLLLLLLLLQLKGVHNLMVVSREPLAYLLRLS